MHFPIFGSGRMFYAGKAPNQLKLVACFSPARTTAEPCSVGPLSQSLLAIGFLRTTTARSTKESSQNITLLVHVVQCGRKTIKINLVRVVSE